jgi:hypothetical protein|tara:strand:+ start:1888 stop:2148 length:261 start_codon:yes stop_codon:yes gene_type:complete
MTIYPLGLISVVVGVENATTLGNATHIYVVEKNNAEAIITITDEEGTTKASFGLSGRASLTFQKESTDKIYSNTANTHFTKIGYAN